MPPKPRRSVPRANRAGAGQLERAKSTPERGGTAPPPRPRVELHPRAVGLGAIERQRLGHALGIDGTDPHALSERIVLLESTPFKELREKALQLGAEAAELDRAIDQAEDRKSAALDLVLAAGQHARAPARPPPQLPERPQDRPPTGAVADGHADDREHEAALMAWYRLYDQPKADVRHVARVVRMFKKRARRLAANGSAPVDWWLLMYAKFEEHNQVDPRDLLNRPVEPQPYLVLPPQPDSQTESSEQEAAAGMEPEPQSVDGTAPTQPEPQPVDRGAPTETESQRQQEAATDAETEADNGAKTARDPQEGTATGTTGSRQLPEGVPPRQNGSPGESADGAGPNAAEPGDVPLLSSEELRSLSGRWFAQGKDEAGPIDERLLLSVSDGGTVVCTVDGAKEDNCTIRNCRIDPTGICELEQVYEDGASTHWRCRYDPSTQSFVDGEWHADGNIIGKFIATRQPPAAASTEPEPEPPATTKPEPDLPRNPGDPPRFVTQRKQLAGGGELLIEWEVGRELGKGHFATAYEITKIEDGSIWAAKVVSKKSLRDFPGRPERFKEELDIHASLVANGCVALSYLLHSILFSSVSVAVPHDTGTELTGVFCFDRVRHPNVLFMESFFEDDDFCYIVLEICPHESLLELLTARKTLTEYEQSEVHRFLP